ncbi:MAG: hypothetical protein IK143_03285 [Bacteroidales bacterium]|nr:hypothetical protein [Bacteroidales bacterium]
MTDTALRDIAGRLLSADLRGASLEKLLAYSRMYSSLFELVTIHGYDEIYGSRVAYKACIKEVARRLSAMYTHVNDPLRRTRILWELNYLQFHTGALPYNLNTPKYDAITYDCLSEAIPFIKALLTTHLSDRESATVFWTLRLLSTYLQRGTRIPATWPRILNSYMEQFAHDPSPEALSISRRLHRLLIMTEYNYMHSATLDTTPYSDITPDIPNDPYLATIAISYLIEAGELDTLTDLRITPNDDDTLTSLNVYLTCSLSSLLRS